MGHLALVVALLIVSASLGYAYHEKIGEVGRGFLALDLRGANALDPVTGNFSVVVTPALIIEGGEVKGFSRFELRGNVWGLLKTTTGVGSELTRVWLDEGLSLSLPFLREEVVV